MNLARRIPLLRDNPVFVLEAGRLWRGRRIWLVCVGTVVALGAGYGLLRGGLQASSALGSSPLSRGHTFETDVMAAVPEGLLIGDVGAAVTHSDTVLSWAGYKTTGLNCLFWLLAALSLALSKYVAPALAAGAVVRWRGARLEEQVLPTRLPSRTVMDGLFGATTWPTLIGAAVAMAVAIPAAARCQDIPFPHPLELSCWLFSVALSSGAVALAAAMVPRRTYYVAFAAIGAVWVMEAVLGVAWLETVGPCGGSINEPSVWRWVISGAFIALRVVIAWLALRLAARLWERRVTASS
jgi:hypothetical protein